ncbi:apolipoprotein D-like [Macrobrachium nipponense]|uniref:apolipoprotein D-like n=1 Tax=Macrobrachium nipponense TaxID=159736 RepID=UPI0030C7C36F
MSALRVTLASLLVGLALAAETFWGRCPTAPAKNDFDMEKFEGIWYLQETFDSGEKCATWNITKGTEPNTWKVIEEKESGAINAVGLTHSDFNSGTITMKNPSKPSQLRIFWPISAIAGDGALTIYSTDYDTYAGVFECQNVGFFHRQNGIVLSRKPILEVEHRQNARIQTPRIKVEYYQRVMQGNCRYKYNNGTNITGTGDWNIPVRGQDGVYYVDEPGKQ